MINQFVRGIINYGFLFNIGRLAGNIYFNNIVNNLMGIPAFLILCITIDNKWLGRKGNFVITLWLAGVASYCMWAFVFTLNFRSNFNKIFKTIFSLFGKMFGLDQMVSISSFVGMFASTAATSVGYVYTAEVYPTEIRNVGVGCCSSCAMGQYSEKLFKPCLPNFISNLIQSGSKLAETYFIWNFWYWSK